MHQPFARHPKILQRDSTALLIIDIQERILNVINNHERIIENSLKLIKGFKILNIPIFCTEQYPKGLGSTSTALSEELQGLSAIPKMSFSCFGAGNLFEQLIDDKITQVVVAGIEAHVCVQQTCFDLLANNFQVNIAADAVSSRKETDRLFALERMSKHGAEVTTTESILFELLNVCGTEEFKQISKIIK